MRLKMNTQASPLAYNVSGSTGDIMQSSEAHADLPELQPRVTFIASAAH